MDKLSPAAFAERDSPHGAAGAASSARGRGLSRRSWLTGALGFGTLGMGLEVLSLGGTWDHREARVRGLLPQQPPVGIPHLTHIGHSCHLIAIAGQRWLTDPWLYDPAFGSLVHEAALPASGIGPLDGIFISHRHPDHFDPRALSQLDKRARVWTADPTLIEPLRQLGFDHVALSHEWQTEVVGALELSFVPAVHDVPQHSLMLAGPDARVLFCGDTGPHEHWSEIRRRYRPTTALLPCDATELRWEPRAIMNAAEAALAAEALGCAQVFPTHADAAYSDPVARYLLSRTDGGAVAALGRALEATGTLGFSPLAIGETRRLFSANSTTL